MTSPGSDEMIMKMMIMRVTLPGDCFGSGWSSRPDQPSQTPPSRTEPEQDNCEETPKRVSYIYLKYERVGHTEVHGHEADAVSPKKYCDSFVHCTRLFSHLQNVLYFFYQFSFGRDSHHVHAVEHVTTSPDHRNLIQELHWVSRMWLIRNFSSD